MTFEFTDESLLKLSSSMVVAHALPAMFASESIHVSADLSLSRCRGHATLCAPYHPALPLLEVRI